MSQPRTDDARSRRLPRRTWLSLPALAVVLAALAALPGESVAWLLLRGDAHAARGEYYQATLLHEQAARREPDSVQVNLRLGQTHLARRRYAQAETALERAWEACGGGAGDSRPNPRVVGSCSSAVPLSLGYLYSRTGRPGLAAEAYRLAWTGGLEEAGYHLALSYLRLDQTELAHQELAILAARGHQLGNLVLGLLLALSQPAAAAGPLRVAAQGADAQASAAARECLASLTAILAEGDPAYSAALVGRAALRARLPEMAVAAFGAAATRNPLYAQAHAYRGYSFYLLGDYDAAEWDLEEARRLAPKDTLPRHFLGLVYRARGQSERAVTELEAALNGDPGNPAILADLGETYALLKDYHQAQEDLTTAAQADPDSPVPWLRLARFHLDTLFAVEDGLAAAERAVSLAPDSPDALDVWGWALHLNRRSEEALPVLRRAAGLAPASASAQYHLGVVAGRLGDTATARQALQRAMDVDVTGLYEPRARRELERLK